MQSAPTYTWKTTVVSGLIGGILLALLQFALLFLDSSHFGLVPAILLGLLFYIVGPGITAFFITRLTKLAHVGYTTALLTGLLCAIISILIIVYSIFTAPPASAYGGYGYVLTGFVNFINLLLIGLNLIGVVLSLIGGSLGSNFAQKERGPKKR